MVKGIQEAGKRFDADSSAMDLKILMTSAAKRQQLKDFKVSPDGFLQMSFQLAYHKLYHKTATTYESASTSAYKHGRTEVIRSATLQSAKFTKAFSTPSATVIGAPSFPDIQLIFNICLFVCSFQVQEKNDALRAAINHHSKITVEALMGNGLVSVCVFPDLTHLHPPRQ